MTIDELLSELLAHRAAGHGDALVIVEEEGPAFVGVITRGGSVDTYSRVKTLALMATDD